jgi:hypothetical protein
MNGFIFPLQKPTSEPSFLDLSFLDSAVPPHLHPGGSVHLFITNDMHITRKIFQI